MALHAMHQLVSLTVPHTQALMHAAYNQHRVHVSRPLQELYLSKQNVTKAGGAEAAAAHHHFSVR